MYSITLISLFFSSLFASDQPGPLTLPIGNGRLAAMIFGQPGRKQLQFNEETVWAGELGNNAGPGVYEPIQQIRKLLFEGKYKEAQALSNKTFPRQPTPTNNYGMPYQTVGNLFISLPGHKAVTNYYRDLDIQQAVASVSYQVKGVTYRRELFASLADQVIVVRLTASKPGSLTFRLSANSPQRVNAVKTETNKPILWGASGNNDNKIGNVKFQAHIVPKLEGGTLSSTDSTLQITGASSVKLYISIGMNFRNFKDLRGNETAQAVGYLTGPLKRPYPATKAAHIADYRHSFDRVLLTLGQASVNNKPTDVRLAEFATSHDPSLASLYFPFGQYLLISSSQPQTQPATLQGKWNDKLAPPWDSKYTVNINTEMNYWLAEVTYLSGLH